MEIQGIVLLSGGLDSVYNLYRAYQEWGRALKAVNFNYGQKAFAAENKAAMHFCGELKISLQTFDISNLFLGDHNALTNAEKMPPTLEVNIESHESSVKTAEKVWVANRNGVLLNAAATVAEIHGASWIIPGFNAEEAATFPDNSVEYIEKMNACLKLSTANAVQIHCFSQAMVKEEMVAELRKMGVSLDSIWSCYFGGDQPCGQCESCQRFARARMKGSH